MICAFFLHGKDSKIVMKHARAYGWYPWVNGNGLMSFNGTDGAQVWDCAFFALSFVSSRECRPQMFESSVQITVTLIALRSIDKRNASHPRVFKLCG